MVVESVNDDRCYKEQLLLTSHIANAILAAAAQLGRGVARTGYTLSDAVVALRKRITSYVRSLDVLNPRLWLIHTRR